MLEKNNGGHSTVSPAMRRRAAPTSKRGQAGKFPALQNGGDGPHRAGPDFNPGRKDERAGENAQNAGEMDAREDLNDFPRPAERRAEEFLTQWLRRLGRR